MEIYYSNVLFKFSNKERAARLFPCIMSPTRAELFYKGGAEMSPTPEARKTTYEKILDLCRRHGIINSDCMTEDELLTILEQLLEDCGVLGKEV